MGLRPTVSSRHTHPLDRIYPRLVAKARLDAAERAWLDRNFAALRALPLAERRTYQCDRDETLAPRMRLALVWGVIATVMAQPANLFAVVLLPLGAVVAIGVHLIRLMGY
uniref:hypothetical protein n=1 Tax=Burkholderia arboris TaxID=488730 RepID=UPI003BEF0876